MTIGTHAAADHSSGPSAGRSPSRGWGLAAALALVSLLALMVPRATRPWAVRAAALLGFYAVIASVLAGTGTARVLGSLRGRSLAAVVLVSVAVFAWGCWYFSLYEFVGVWDYIAYWRQTLQLNEAIDAGPLRAVVDAFRTVNDSDYNDVQCLVYSLPVALAPSWSACMLAELALFTMPAAAVTSAFAVSRLRGRAHGGAPAFGAVYLLVICCPLLLRPVFCGYMDAPPALLFVSVLAALFDDGLPARKAGALLVGLGVTGTFVLRRWFVYAALPLAAATVAYWLVRVAAAGQDRGALAARVVRAGALVALGASLPLATLFRRFVVRSVTGNYGFAYGSWTRFSDYGSKFADVALSFGWGWLALGAVLWAAAVFRTLRSEAHGNSVAQLDQIVLPPLFLLTGALALSWFWQTQDLSPQHYLIAVFYLDLAVAVPIAGALSESRRAEAGRAAVSLLAVACLALGMGVVRVPQVPLPFGCPTFGPFVQDNVQAKHDLVDYLAREAGGGEVYFAAASVDLNETLVPSHYLPDTHPPFMPRSADVDSRDGFNVLFFGCDYVVTSDPASFHMAPENERVVSTLNGLVRDGGSFIGRHFEPARTFDFGSGVEVGVYRRTSDFTLEDVESLQSIFDGLYPDWTGLFHDRFETVKEAMRSGTLEEYLRSLR